MKTPQRLLVLVNPAAGGGRARQAESAVKAYWRAQGVQALFQSPGGLDELRQSVRQAPASGFSVVAALGGDGTFHQVLNAAHGLDISLGLIPAGGGNDIARALGLPADPVEAAHRLLQGQIRQMDAIRLRAADGRETLYAGAGGAGLDAEAARLANQRFRHLPGLSRYVVAAVAAFREAGPMQITLEADGATNSFTALLVAVANSPSYGNGVRIAPAADPFDGWMDVAIVAPLRWGQLLDGLMLALRDGDIRWPELRRLRARRLRLSTNRPVTFHGDGEVLGETPVELELLPGAVRLIV